MAYKRSIALILMIFIFWDLEVFAKTKIYQPGWKPHEITKEHGPFYSDSLIGVVIQDGNTVDNTISFLSVNDLVLESEIFQLGGHYNYGWDEKGLSSRNWDLRTRYQRKLRKNINPFVAYIVEGDPFAGYSNRNNFDLGISFPFEGKIFSYEMEAGYRYTVELPTDDIKRFQSKLRIHAGGDWKVGKSGEVKIWIRYMPFLSDTQGGMPNYMLDYGVSLNSFFAENFYLNLSFLGNFREVPLEDRKQNDYKLIGSIGFKL